MNLFGLLIVGFGIYSICGAVYNWDFFFTNYKAQFLITALGRDGARQFSIVTGVILAILGVLMTFRIVQ